LFSKLGYLYGGSGDFFRLPDLRGEFIRGADLGRGIDAGRVVGSQQIGSLSGGDFDGLSAQTAGSVGPTNPNNGRSWTGLDDFNPADYPNTYLATGISGAVFLPTTTPQFFGVMRPRNVALIACIKAFGEIDEPDQILAANVLTSINSIIGGVFGVNQSWIKYSASERLFNVTYFNSTPKPIMVNIGCYHLSASSYNEYYVNDVLVGFSTSQGAANQVGVGGTVSFVVPSGQTYKAIGGSKTSISTWAELR
jgi:hypothetical protein